MEHRSIAIDGPSGAGKSTLAKRLAQELGFFYVDTGAIYRTVGLAARRRGIDPGDGQAVEAMLPQLTITMGYGEDGLQRMISACASKAAAIPAVRGFLMEMQRRAAREHDVIMDGRDIGTVVLPGAGLKIFLTAAPEERARRRCRELLERGQRADFDQVLREVTERDRRDTEREASPLRRGEDAVLADTTGLDLEGSFQLLLGLVRERLGSKEERA